MKTRWLALATTALLAVVAVSCSPKEVPVAPKVLRQDPPAAAELAPTAPITIEFNEAIDPKTVEGQVTIEPTVAGDWNVNDYRLIFQPSPEGFAWATTYRVVVGSGVKSTSGVELADEVVLRFQTAGYLQVSQVQPADGTIDVERNSTIVVVFNRPVVPLTDLRQAAGLPQPLALEPAVEGTGEWLNTSIYVFRPTDGLAGSTTYKCTVAAGLQDTTGSILPESFSWSFTTESPKVVKYAPEGAKIAPDTSVEITFNQPMDTASVEQGFSVRSALTQQPVGGTFAWDGETVTFTPSARLEFGATYIAAVAAGVRSATGGELTGGLQWQFTVVPMPRVIGSMPVDGDMAVDPYTGVEIHFAGPMLMETITPTLRVEPEETEWQPYWNDYDDILYISMRLEPATDYRIVVPGAAADPYGNTLGADYILSFRTRDLPPTVYLQSPYGAATVFSTYSDMKVHISYRNVSQVRLSLYSLALEDFLRLNGNDWQFRDTFTPQEKSLLSATTVPVQPPRNEIETQEMALTLANGQPVPAGVYYLTVTSPGIKAEPYQSAMPMLVTSTNLVVKKGPKDVLVWVTDLNTGQTVGSLPITVYDANQKALLAGTTDADGIWRGQLPDGVDTWAPMLFVAGSGESLSVTSSQWADGLYPWDFSLPSENWVTPYIGYFYTDRPIYRPGQTVYFKGIIRADNDAAYGLPDLTQVEVTVTDSQGQQFYDRTLSVSDLGTVDGQFVLADEASVGSYFISAAAVKTPQTAKTPTSFGTVFQVAEYVKPEYEISVSTDKTDYVQGDSVNVMVSAKYYFGAPVANAKVMWNVTVQPYFFPWSGKGWFDFYVWDYWTQPYKGTEALASGETTTDSAGNATFSLPADIQKFSMSQVFSVEATVIDASKGQVSGRTAVSVHKGEYYIGLSPQGYVGTVGAPQKVSVITVGPKSEPVPNVPLTVVFALRKWYSVQEKSSDGQFYWTTQFTDTPVFTQTLTTDANGSATAEFTPTAGGPYRVFASGSDSRGNPVQSASFVWIVGRADEYVSWRVENNNRIDLIPDQKTYAPGDVAHVLVSSPYQGPVQALLTIERAGILSHQVITLQSNSESLDIPITEGFIPDVFVSVVLVKGKTADDPFASFRVGYAQLVVSSAQKALEVRLTPEKATYGPRDTARFSVETLDASGQGVSAEVSLALVDASVLALAQRSGPGIVDFFYRQRGLGIQTATNLTLAPSEQEVQPPSGGKGGGGGESEFGVRTEFPDTAYWNATLRTDAAGKAEVEVPLPDSLTTWRMLSEAVTGATQVGESTADIVVTRDLLVRPVTPRFLVIGDKPEIAAVVHNNTSTPIQTNVTLTAEGLSLEGGAQNVEIPAYGLQRLAWNGAVGNVEQVTLTFRAAGGGLEDAIALTLPVYHFSTPEVVATAGEVAAGEQRMEIVQLPDVYDPTQGDLTLRVDPSLVAGMEEGFTYLEHYPYECAEQTVSRFLPNVVTWRAYKEMNVPNPDLEARLPDLVAEGMQKLYAAQNLDGGWGWWRAEQSNPFVTAYVVLGFVEAKRAGFAVDDAVMQRGVQFLQDRLRMANLSLSSEANSQAFMLYVLSEAGVQDSGRATALYEKRQLLGQYGKAYLVMALQPMGDAHAAQIQTLVAEITGQAVLSATGAHWEETGADVAMMNTDIRSTAIVLRALLRVDPENALLPNAVRWLMAARQEGRWATTQENTWATMGLTDYVVKTGELEGTYSFQVGLNGKRLLSGDVNPQNVGQGQSVSVPVSQLLQDVGNRVLLERMPVSKDQPEQGSLYYSADLKYFLPVEDIEPLNRGILVTREYTLDGKPDETIENAKVGDIIRVKLTLIAPGSLHYLALEDPIPAGTEAVDTSLRTTSQLAEAPQFGTAEPEDDIWGWWIFSHTEIRDEKVALFADSVPAGTYEYTYLLRASVAGEFLVMPTVAYQMYFPETFGRTAGELFIVTGE